MEESIRPYRILFLCTGNSARSIFGEYLIRKAAPHLFDSFSAGAYPVGKVNPLALRVLKEGYQIDASDAWSKSCDEVNHIEFDFVITVCDKAKETCPIWPGQPIVAHWGVPDPVEAKGTDHEKLLAFRQVAQIIKRRIDLLCALPLDKLDRLKLEALTREIGTKGVEEAGGAVA